MRNKTMIEVNDVTMRFHMNLDKILSLKEFVARKLSGKLASRWKRGRRWGWLGETAQEKARY